jgi:hypothetical protein
MAEPARQLPPAPEEPPIDPDAIDRAYHLHRAKRRARIEHKRTRRLARLRFWLVVVGLVAAVVLLALTVWREVQDLFGI